MGKVSFTKLNLTKNPTIRDIFHNGQTIEVKQYLPIEDKLKLVADVLNAIQDENNFVNSVKLMAYTRLQIVLYYTNINFTEKQKEDAAKTYDLLEANGVIDLVIGAIPSQEYQSIISGVSDIAEHIYQYRNSVYGILDAMKTDYSNLELDASKIQKEIADPENLTLLKDVINKLG